MSEDIAVRIARLERGILRAVKDTAQSIPMELSVFVGEFLRGPEDQKGLRKSKTGNLYYTIPNKQKRLRTLYGNIQRSITPGERGNISDVQVTGGQFVVNFGYDPATTVKAGTRTTTLEYAVINEATRPFLAPGLRKFMKNANGYKALMRELETAIVDEFQQEFG